MKNILMKVICLFIFVPCVSFSAKANTNVLRDGQIAGQVAGAIKHPYLRGGGIIEGHKGIVKIQMGGLMCTGSMLANNIIMTAAHCLGGVGVDNSSEGNGSFVVDYFDPQGGERRVYNGRGRWYVPTSYNHKAKWNTAKANSDIAVIRTDRNFTNTDSSDYLVIYDDKSSHLKSTLNAYGAGTYTYSKKFDGNLRGNWFSVEHVKKNHIVIDTRKKVGICKGDSGGPLIYIPNTPKPTPMLAGVASIIEFFGFENKVCTNNDWGIDDAKYSRANWGKISTLFSKAGISCSPHFASGIRFRKCFAGNPRESTNLTFDCRIESSNKGCEKVISCPTGTKIFAAKAACNLEFGAVKNSDLNKTEYGRINVIRKSDRVHKGICSIGNTKIKEGKKSFDFKGVIGKSSTKIFCKEHDKNGGDCHIRASIVCL